MVEQVEFLYNGKVRVEKISLGYHIMYSRSNNSIGTCLVQDEDKKT